MVQHGFNACAHAFKHTDICDGHFAAGVLLAGSAPSVAFIIGNVSHVHHWKRQSRSSLETSVTFIIENVGHVHHWKRQSPGRVKEKGP